MNLSSIVMLLQLVLAMLSNSNTSQNTQTQALATRAIGYATQALQTAIVSKSTNPQIAPSQNAIQPAATGTLYCDSYSGGICVSWKYSSVVTPSLNAPQVQNQPSVAVFAPPNCPSEILAPSQLSLLPAGCPMPAIVGQQLQNSEAASNSANDVEELQNQYAQDLGIIHNTPGGLALQQGEENALNELYNAELRAAQLNAPCFSPDLTLAGGEQGLQALQNAMSCASSLQ